MSNEWQVMENRCVVSVWTDLFSSSVPSDVLLRHNVRGFYVQNLLVARDDGSVFADGSRHPAQDYLSVFEADQIRLPVEPWIIGWCPCDRNEFLSGTNLACALSAPFANGTEDFSGSTTNLARPGVHRITILIRDDMSDVVLIPRHRTAIRVSEGDPYITRTVSGDVHVPPRALGQFEAITWAIHLAAAASGCVTGHCAGTTALETYRLTGAWPGGCHWGRRRNGAHIARAVRSGRARCGGLLLSATDEQRRAGKQCNSRGNRETSILKNEIVYVTEPMVVSSICKDERNR